MTCVDPQTNEVVFNLQDLIPVFKLVIEKIEGRTFKYAQVQKIREEVEEGKPNDWGTPTHYVRTIYKSYPALVWSEPAEIEKAVFSDETHPGLKQLHEILKCACIFTFEEAKRIYIKINLIVNNFGYLIDVIDFLNEKILSGLEPTGENMVSITEKYLTPEKIIELKSYKFSEDEKRKCRFLKTEINPMISPSDLMDKVYYDSDYKEIVRRLVEGKFGKQKSISNQ